MVTMVIMVTMVTTVAVLAVFSVCNQGLGPSAVKQGVDCKLEKNMEASTPTYPSDPSTNIIKTPQQTNPTLTLTFSTKKNKNYRSAQQHNSEKSATKYPLNPQYYTQLPWQHAVTMATLHAL